MNHIYKYVGFATALIVAGGLCSCEDTKSYSELLNEEEHAVNWFLAQHEVCLEIPENGDFKVGEKAPYYKMDVDGNVYMQVLDKGTPLPENATDSEKDEIEFQKGNKVYFRMMRMNIKYFQLYGTQIWEGNADDMSPEIADMSFIYGNSVLTSTTQYGDGIQLPLKYLHNNCEVNLIVKSPQGWTSEQSSCTPYLYNIQYFKAIY